MSPPPQRGGSEGWGEATSAGSLDAAGVPLASRTAWVDLNPPISSDPVDPGLASNATGASPRDKQDGARVVSLDRVADTIRLSGVRIDDVSRVGEDAPVPSASRTPERGRMTSAVAACSSDAGAGW